MLWRAMDQLTAGSALTGGMLIGLAASLLLLCNGRIAGISGIVGGLLDRRGMDAAWRLAFVAGLLSGGALVRVVAPDAVPGAAAWSASTIVAGLLVGFGTQLGSGCTSGHGVCGISRGSPRSLAATATFMAAGMVTVYVARHVVGGMP